MQVSNFWSASRARLLPMSVDGTLIRHMKAPAGAWKSEDSVSRGDVNWNILSIQTCSRCCTWTIGYCKMCSSVLVSCKTFVVDTECGPSARRNLGGSMYLWAPCFWVCEHAFTPSITFKDHYNICTHIYIYIHMYVYMGSHRYYDVSSKHGLPYKINHEKKCSIFMLFSYSELLDMRWRCLFLLFIGFTVCT